MTNLEALKYELQNLRTALLDTDDKDKVTMEVTDEADSTVTIKLRDADNDEIRIGSFVGDIAISALPEPVMGKQMILVNGILMERDWKLLFAFIVGYHD